MEPYYTLYTLPRFKQCAQIMQTKNHVTVKSARKHLESFSGFVLFVSVTKSIALQRKTCLPYSKLNRSWEIHPFHSQWERHLHCCGI